MKKARIIFIAMAIVFLVVKDGESTILTSDFSGIFTYPLSAGFLGVSAGDSFSGTYTLDTDIHSGDLFLEFGEQRVKAAVHGLFQGNDYFALAAEGSSWVVSTLPPDIDADTIVMDFHNKTGDLISWGSLPTILDLDHFDIRLSFYAWKGEVVERLNGDVDTMSVSVPEPATFILMWIGLVGVGFAWRRLSS